ncbi:hypothetical protein BDR05DRAFT_997678 [Suillus weaverae]|nr:hypothetical protein BDR05DRAFT_997678 [Suillus weaverae]
MSIDTEHQNLPPATASTSDPKGKGKEKEVDPSAYEDMSDSEESGDDTWAEYPFEPFPSPPGDKSRTTRAPNVVAPLDPPLITFTYPPPPHLASDPTWYAQMVADVHRNRAHVNAELELARTEAAEALADATLAELELKAERDQMQDFLNRIGSVAGKNFVLKMIRKVERSLKTGDESLELQYPDDEELQYPDDEELQYPDDEELQYPDDEELQYPDDEEPQYPDDEDSNGSDEGEVDHQDVEEDFGGGSGDSEEGSQDAEDEEYSRSGDDSYRERSEFPSASRPCSPYRPEQYHHKFVRDDGTTFWESSYPLLADESPNSSYPLPADESPHSFYPLPADESPNSSLQGISLPYQPFSPDWRCGDVTDDPYSSGEDDASRKWIDSSPTYRSRKRRLEVEEETNDPEDSPRKKFKETPPSPLKDVKLFPLPTRCFYPPENKQDNAIDQDHDADEEHEVENSRALEHEPRLSTPDLPRLNLYERNPFVRVRQKSQG